MKKQKLPIVEATHGTKSDIESKNLTSITNFILKNASIEKIICFGSTVTSTKNTSCFVTAQNEADPQQLNSYCILVVPTETECQPDVIMQQTLERELKTIANVTVIIHRMEEINLALQNGSSFFTSIYKKGILLHDSGNEPFVTPEKGAEVNKRIIKREIFWDRWFKLSENFLLGARFYSTKQKNNLAIFMLHQTLQHCYSGTLRVLTGYRSNSNSLRRLLNLMLNILPGSPLAFSKDTPEDTRLTGLLLKGFGEARYNDKFEATDEEVTILINRIDQILASANQTCLERIKNIKEGKMPYTA